jgi:two-component sensor histidine kinase
MRRVATIALVHETLSEGLGETVDFDDVVDRTVAMAVEVAGASGPVRVLRAGSFGELEAENATPLALVLTELVTNAVEHGLAAGGGTVLLEARRSGRQLHVVVQDDGAGLPAGFVAGKDGLGTQIVKALVGGEMRGRIGWSTRPEGGTEVTVDVTLRGRAADDQTSDDQTSDGQTGDDQTGDDQTGDDQTGKDHARRGTNA